MQSPGVPQRAGPDCKGESTAAHAVMHDHIPSRRKTTRPNDGFHEQPNELRAEPEHRSGYERLRGFVLGRLGTGRLKDITWRIKASSPATMQTEDSLARRRVSGWALVSEPPMPFGDAVSSPRKSPGTAAIPIADRSGMPTDATVPTSPTRSESPIVAAASRDANASSGRDRRASAPACPTRAHLPPSHKPSSQLDRPQRRQALREDQRGRRRQKRDPPICALTPPRPSTAIVAAHRPATQAASPAIVAANAKVPQDRLMMPPGR